MPHFRETPVVGVPRNSLTRANAGAPANACTRVVKILYTCLTAGDGVVSGVVLSRMGWPDDIAPVIACLAAEHGRWATGQVLDATGGSSL